jgi:hypothetical protein
MTANPAPWSTVSSSQTVDATIPAPILFYLIRATDGVGESSN